MLKLFEWHVIGLLFLLLASIKTISAGSCREASLCCNGRDSSCVVQKAPINAIIEDLNDKPCYCDHACLKLGDCCHDFKDHCGVNDCEVSAWGPWSECDTDCGTGQMSRTRSVERQPQNGGKHCPSLLQKRGCQGFKCSRHHDRRVLKESALLLPASLSKNRHANDTQDIRRNLRLRYRESTKHNRDYEYCVEFEVIKASKPCHKITPYNKLAAGDRVMVRCDVEAMIEEKPTKTEEIQSNSSILDDEEATLTNQTNNHSSKKPSKLRCRGEGLPGRNNRFSALAVPSCRGKWMRLTVGEPKKCSDSQFIFV